MILISFVLNFSPLHVVEYTLFARQLWRKGEHFLLLLLRFLSTAVEEPLFSRLQPGIPLVRIEKEKKKKGRTSNVELNGMK